MDHTAKHNTIAMDGPAASGKSTIGYLLAQELGFLFLDTGLMYRAATFAALQQGIDVADETAVTTLSRTLQLDIQPPDGKDDGRQSDNRQPDNRQATTLLDGQDITWQLRSPAVDKNVSLVSSYVGVREEMVRRQREFGQRGQVVMVGRDIGTVVMPSAPLKLYITASAAERTRRRWHDRQEQGHNDSYDAILTDVKRRDQFDSGRQHSPLRPADDAITIDTTNLTPEAIINKIMELVHVRLK